MVKITAMELDNHEKAVLAEAKKIISDLISEFSNDGDSVYIHSKNCNFDGDEWGLFFLDEIKEVLFSLSESDTISGEC